MAPGDFPKKTMTRAVFLDRDGTLVKDKGYICHFAEVEIFSFAIEAVRLMNLAGYRVFVVTNQSAVARGICSQEEIEQLHRQLQEFFSDGQAVITAVYCCPYLSGAPLKEYDRVAECRKPAPGMLLQAAKDFQVDLKLSFMIGDELKDLQAGSQAGCQTVLVRTGKGVQTLDFLTTLASPPTLVADNLLEAARWIFSLQEK